MDQAMHPLKEGTGRLAADFRAVVSDAEQLLRVAANQAGDGYAEARERLEASLKAARHELETFEHEMVDGVRRAGRATDGYVRTHPWESIAIGAGIGVVVALLIARR